MVEIAVSDLSPELRQLAVKAREAAQRGDIAVVEALCQQILIAQPSCVGIRKLWFELELQQGVRAASLLSRLRGLLYNRATQPKSGDSPVDGCVKADALLAAEFSNRRGWQNLIRAAHDQAMIETELLAWRAYQEVYPADSEIGLGRARALRRAERDREALEVAQQVLARYPNDGQALALVRQISVALTMKSGKLKDGGNPLNGS